MSRVGTSIRVRRSSTSNPSEPPRRFIKDTRGSDAGKRVSGRKRHIAVDTLGLLLVAAVSV
ncbi:transposase [Streptomyces sp. NPDC005529]|uniref:transposase n=1 Tax=unclassified Streptomyces TaxID=2593676 RepID=UPI0036ABD25B